MRLAAHCAIHLGEEVAEGIAVAFCMAGRVARQDAGVLHDDPRRLGRAVQQDVRLLLVPREAAPLSFDLEQQLVLSAGCAG
ncbi:MAG: hypothetical protein E6G08_07915 [Actinobacteria bacterium]|nr:MAG: hypothetical protein E6G08_07915 [Actinomycetota bacterium]